MLKSKSYLNAENVGSSSQSPTMKNHHRDASHEQHIGLAMSSTTNKNTNSNPYHAVQNRSGIAMLDQIQIGTTSHQSPLSSKERVIPPDNIIRSGSDITPWHQNNRTQGHMKEVSTAINEEPVRDSIAASQPEEDGYRQGVTPGYRVRVEKQPISYNTSGAKRAAHDSIGMDVTVGDTADAGQTVSLERTHTHD